METLTAETAADVLEGELPVLVDFSAEWCPPCRAMDPVVAELARRYAGRVRVATCDMDQELDLALRYGVRAAPTFVFLSKGKAVERIVGAVPRAKLEAMIERGLASPG